MGLFFHHTEAEQTYDPYALSRQELNLQFAPENWSKMSVSDRYETIRALECSFAAEQGREPKDISFLPMEGSCYGYWSEAQDRIVLNNSLVTEGCFTYKGISSGEMADAPIQIYDTVAHEGYHAYQSYAISHPEVHADQEQLRQWSLNDSGKFIDGHYESNYYAFDNDRDKYRIQPLERDAYNYGEAKTREAFDAIEKKYGPVEGYAEYKNTCQLNSYENALTSAQAQDPQVLQNMEKEMQLRQMMWDNGLSCDNKLSETAAEEAERQRAFSQYDYVKTMDAPYAQDEGYYVHSLGAGLGSRGTRYVPSLQKQYLDGVKGINELYFDRNESPEIRSAYMQELRGLQDQLGYYPEFDARMQAIYKDQMRVGAESIGPRVLEAEQNNDLEALKQYRDQIANYDTAVRDSLGYYNYEPQTLNTEEFGENAAPGPGESTAPEVGERAAAEQVQHMSADEDVMEDLNESAGEDMSALYGETATTEGEGLMDNLNESAGEDMSALYGETATTEGEGLMDNLNESAGEDMSALYGETATTEGEGLMDNLNESAGEDMSALYGGSESNQGENESEEQSHENDYSQAW